MARARMVLVALMWMVPAAALAHEPGEHPFDPNLRVNPSLEDCSVQFSPFLTQDAFRRFAREFGSVSAFKMMAPPTTLGRGGIAVELEQISFTVEERAPAWNETFAHPDGYHELGSDLAFPKLRLRVGVTDDIDVGAFYTKNLNANYGWFGLEGKYGLLQQSEAKPVTLALRAAYTKTLYVTDMDMHAITADVSAGRTFRGMLTPYLGLGSDLVLVRETTDVVALQSEEQVVPHAFAGLQLRYWHVTLGAEANWGELTSLQFQLGAAF